MATLGSGDGFLGSTAAGAVGTYSWLRSTFSFEWGDTVAGIGGTQYRPSGALQSVSYSGSGNGNVSSPADAFSNIGGTWRCMGRAGLTIINGAMSGTSSTLWLRIAQVNIT